jgi:hypothetical protein
VPGSASLVSFGGAELATKQTANPTFPKRSERCCSEASRLFHNSFLNINRKRFKIVMPWASSGLMVTNDAIQAEFAKGGKTIDLPFFGDLSGDSEILDDTTGLTAATLAGDVQTGVRNIRGRAWKASDLAGELAGSDPMQAIARRTGQYWVRDMQKTMINVLKGLFASGGPLISSHSVGGTGVALSQGLMVDGIAKLGDAGQELTGVIMRSPTYYSLMKLDLIEPASTTSQLDTRLSIQRLELGTYLGRPVFVDDTLPTEAGTGDGAGKLAHHTYFFGPGAFAYANAPAKTPVETDRDSLKGIDFLINRTHYLIHPNGISWVGNAAGNAPTNTELAAGTNWDKVFY